MPTISLPVFTNCRINIDIIDYQGLSVISAAPATIATAAELTA